MRDRNLKVKNLTFVFDPAVDLASNVESTTSHLGALHQPNVELTQNNSPCPGNCVREKGRCSERAHDPFGQQQKHFPANQSLQNWGGAWDRDVGKIQHGEA